MTGRLPLLTIAAFLCLAAGPPGGAAAGPDAPPPADAPRVHLRANADLGRRCAWADPRDGRVYATVRIGDREWFAENLDFDHPRSWCYDDDPENGRRLGRLYDWTGALEAAPPGWRLPTDEDWRSLERSLGMDEAEVARPYGPRGSDQGARLKAGGGAGFDALLAGHRGPTGAYGYLDASGDFWSATEHDARRAVTRQVIDESDGIIRNTCPKALGLSVRCVRDLRP